MLQLFTTFISTSDWLRISLIFCHLLACAFAISAVLRTDINIVLGKFSREEIGRAASGISALLMALWVTGLAIIYIDTGFSPAILATKSKLLLKLLCVVTLTLNGMVLHQLSFPILTRDTGKITTKESILLVVTGALSTSHWMLAAFVGLSKPLGRLPFFTLLEAYIVFVAAVVAVSLLFIPLLSRVTLASTPKLPAPNNTHGINLKHSEYYAVALANAENKANHST